MDSESDSQDELGFESDGFGGADPYVKVCRTAAGPAQLHGLPSGENCSTVGARTVLHNMLRRTADLDRELQVFGDVTLSFCLLHDFLRSDSDVIVYVCIWSLIKVPTFLLKTSTHPRPQLYAKAYHPGSVQRPCP